MGTLGQDGQDHRKDKKGPGKRQRNPIDSNHGALIPSKKERGPTRPRKKRKTRLAFDLINADFHLPMIQLA